MRRSARSTLFPRQRTQVGTARKWDRRGLIGNETKWERRVSGKLERGQSVLIRTLPAQIHPLDFQIGHAEAPSLLLSEFANRWQHFPHKVRRS